MCSRTYEREILEHWQAMKVLYEVLYIRIYIYMYCKYPNILCSQEECNDGEELR